MSSYVMFNSSVSINGLTPFDVYFSLLEKDNDYLLPVPFGYQPKHLFEVLEEGIILEEPILGESIIIRFPNRDDRRGVKRTSPIQAIKRINSHKYVLYTVDAAYVVKYYAR